MYEHVHVHVYECIESAHVYTHMYVQHNILSHVSTLSFHLVDQPGVCVVWGDDLIAVFD